MSGTWETQILPLREHRKQWQALTVDFINSKKMETTRIWESDRCIVL
jgi:hypothetical protein